MTDQACWAVIPAAGIGTRMGAEVPKQYLQIAGRPILAHTLERFCTHPKIKGVVVALGPDDGWFDSLEIDCADRLRRIDGGQERCHSVLNALQFLAGRADTQDWVLVHDAARPCVREDDISRLIEQVQPTSDGGLLALPVRDTMKRGDADNRVSGTVDRDRMWHALTPQMFRLGELTQALREAIDANKLVTDEASAMELAGKQPLLVEGHAGNIKVTLPQDLALAELYLS